MHSIIVSKKDIAGINIADKLINNFKFEETDREFDGNKIYEKGNFQLVTINEFQVYADYVNELETDLLIFASKHSSKTGPAALTVHAPGNWGKAELGGKDRELCPTYANLLKNYLVKLERQKEERKLENSVILEVSHHGAHLTKPAVYIEIGSNTLHWKSEEAALAVAETIVNATKLEGSNTIAIALGGGHYPIEFTKLVLRKNYALSHICPKYALGDFNEEMLIKAIEATKEPVDEIVLDYKGLGTEKARIKEILDRQELPIKRVRNLLKE